MPDIAGVRVGSMRTEDENVVALKGMPSNPGRDPKSKQTMEKGTIGAIALTDSLIIVGLAWGVLILLAYSLRHHNV
jgi:hypothetical protein